jgi:hypothetical protein
VAWWHDLDIKALEIAKQLWEQSHALLTPENAISHAPPSDDPGN